jgi:hypothetical protein
MAKRLRPRNRRGRGRTHACRRCLPLANGMPRILATRPGVVDGPAGQGHMRSHWTKEESPRTGRIVPRTSQPVTAPPPKRLRVGYNEGAGNEGTTRNAGRRRAAHCCSYFSWPDGRRDGREAHPVKGTALPAAAAPCPAAAAVSADVGGRGSGDDALAFLDE